MRIQLKGLTWDHPRATLPLRAAREPLQRALPDIEIAWEVQPLSGFEARPIAEAARAYDLVIFDHPHVGEIQAQQLFLPLEHFESRPAFSDSQFAGASLASYRYCDQTWGLPLDTACQVSCARADLLADLGEPMPEDWGAVLALGERARSKQLRFAIGFNGVHALMSMLSLCANQGAPLAVAGNRAFPDREVARRALRALAELLPFCAAEAVDWNSIAAQDAMCSRHDLLYCPLVYGFSPYSRIDRSPRLSYSDMPGITAGCSGSTLGGAGLGVSAFSKHPQAAFDAAVYLVDAQVQCEILALNDGQPARTQAWDSAAVNLRYGDFYSRTRRSIDNAWVRPRFNGYLQFQKAGGPLVEAFLRGHGSIDATLDQLEHVWSAALALRG